MEALGINVGYLMLQVCIFMIIPVVILVSVVYFLFKKEKLSGAETLKIIEVSEQGAIIPKELLAGVEILEVKKKQDILYLVPAKEKSGNSI